MRRAARARSVVAPVSLLAIVRDWLTAADPGLVRLTLASRGTLSVFLATVIALIATRIGGYSVADFASGITLSIIAPFVMRDPTRRQRQRTLLLLVPPAALSTVATALLHGHGPVGDSCFLILVFVCFLLHPRSPRMIGMGLVAVVMAYIGLFLELPPATLPLQLLSLAASPFVVAFVCFVVFPIKPAATLRLAVAAVQGRVARVLRTARDVTAADAAGAAALTRLRRDVTRLNEAALAADDQLALLHPDGRDAVRDGLIELELATARLIAVLREGAPTSRTATRLDLHARRMRRGHRYAMAPDLPEPGTLRAALVALGHAVHGLGVAARTLTPAPDVPAAVPPPGPLAWRMAARVTFAAALAMAGGMALSPQRWFWAVITVYVVFLTARSRGDTVLRGLQRVAGTVLGMASGLVLAALLAGHGTLQAAALLLSVFGMYYYIMTSYTAGIFCVTVMLGLLYGMLGGSPATLLVLRLEETVIGAAAAIFVAFFVLPTRTRDDVRSTGRIVLLHLVRAVHASRRALSGHTEAAPMAAMRLVDRQVANLRLALAPLTAGRALLRRSALERPVPALLDCVHWTRVLAAASHAGSALSPVTAAALDAQARGIERHLARLAGAPEPDRAAEPADVVCRIEPADADRADPDAAMVTLKTALDRLDHAVTMLAERIEIGALQGFSLDG